MAWTAPKIALLLSRAPTAKAWHPPAPARMTQTSPRQLASMEKSGVSRG
jgi:hypothetical protein